MQETPGAGSPVRTLGPARPQHGPALCPFDHQSMGGPPVAPGTGTVGNHQAMLSSSSL